jgi:pimeloyl-ACP methyl ester carboxylesterase
VKDAFRDPAHLSAVLGYYRAMFSSQNRVLRKRTRVPALYLHGVEDGCVGVELCEGVERAYTAGVRVRRLSGAGHFLHLDQPDAFNAELLDFLDRAR